MMLPKVRKYAGWGLLALLTAVFPANIHMAVQEVQIAGLPPVAPWILWARLPLQFLFAGVIYYLCIFNRSAANEELP